jgi:CelD/BcsL family acetyltransferase involved in cellulose biosynthesis
MPQADLAARPIAHRAADDAAQMPSAADRPEAITPSHADLPSSASPPIAEDAPCCMRRASRSGVDLEVHGDPREVEADWRAFEQRADCTVFQVYDWIAKWQRHVGARRRIVPAIVLGRDDEGNLLFILPLAIETRGGVRRLTWLGSELCDYNAPLLAPHFGDQQSAQRFGLLWQDIVNLLQTHPQFRFDLIDLQKMPEAVGAQRNPFLNLKVLVNPSGAHIATLTGDWDAFYAAKRSPATRKRERRQFKHLAELGEVRFGDVEEREDVERTLTAIFEQKARSFARMGVENIFARPGHREFFFDVATDPGTRALVHLTRLDVGNTMAAANVGLRFRDCYSLILSSYQDGDIARFGPGRAHLHELLRQAIDRGFRTFDFTIGDEAYKRDWCDTEMKLYDYLAAATMRGRLVVAMTMALRRVKRFIKQTPALWHAFSKARAIAHSLGLR